MEKFSPGKRLWHLLIPDIQEIRNIYIYAVFIGFLNLTLPLGIQAIINLIQGGAVSSSWVVLVTLVTLGVLLSGILQINQLQISENLQQKIFTRAAFEFAYRVPRIQQEKLFRIYAPELMNRFFDVVSVQKGLTKILIEFSSAAIQVIFGLILLSFYHPFFILFSLLLLILILLIFRYTAKRGLKTSLSESKNKYKMVHWLEEMSRSSLSFKLVGNRSLAMNRVNESAGKYIKAREDHFQVLKQQYSLLLAFKVIVAMGLLLIGGLLVINQQMNLGQFVASEIVILLVINAVEKLILSTETIYDVLTSLEKIGHVTDLPLQKNGQRMLSEPSEGIAVELDRISFTFPGDMKPTLSKIDMNVQSGNRVLIRGTSNSGKATLLKVMCGLLSPTEGLLRVNEYSFSTIDYDSLYQYTGVYLRSESLFDGTLYENISLGREGLKEEDVKNTLFDLGLEKWFRQLDLGMETSVCSNGQDYSQALVSKLLMARAICHKPKLLVLENPISSFDSKEAESILTFLLDKKHPWTLIMSSNNSLMEPSRFDQAIVLDGGEIISKTN